jgi:hypothetical protein
MVAALDEVSAEIDDFLNFFRVNFTDFLNPQNFPPSTTQDHVDDLMFLFKNIGRSHISALSFVARVCF